jgi:hypothetical protein
MDDTKTKTIRLGICMAGAVSAGAYTAGVIDYLVETLERWERKKNIIRKKNKAGEVLRAEEELVPLHDVVIEVLSGASAGGMTAAVLAYSFNDNTYITKRNNDLIQENYNIPDKNDSHTKLYNSWIKMTDDEKGSTFSKLMDTSDVVSINQMTSLLNSNPIDEIAAKAVPEKINFNPPPYISKNLSIVLSVTNVEGVPVDIRFSNIDETNPTRNVLQMHSGYLHYQFEEHEYLLDFPPEIISEEFKDHLAAAAKATGAFPFGLANRKIFVTQKLFEEFKRRMKVNYKMNVNAEIPNEGHYVFTAVDGGAINNEPVGTTVKILNSKRALHYKEDSNYVILIDPFPTVTNASQDNTYTEPKRYTLTQQALKLVDAFRNQSAFKQEDLLNSFEMEENKYLIYPAKRRYYYLASGEIGGFSGFLKKSFREHDYQLGRKNCQAFLRYYFGEDIEKLKTMTDANLTSKQVEKWRYNVNFGKKGKEEKWKFPLIPDMLMLNPEAPEIASPEYDGLTTDEMKAITGSIDVRIEKIVEATYPSLIEMGKSANGFVGFGMKILKGFIKRKIRESVSDKVNNYLHKTFSPQLIKQEILVTKFADIIEKKGELYQKSKGVYAVIAEGGEKIISRTSDGVETTNIASKGDYIVQNDTTAKEKYIVKASVFNERYVHSHDNFFNPSVKTQVHALQLTDRNISRHGLTAFGKLVTESGTDAFIEAPWRESQKVQLNDYLVCLPSKNEVYRIANAEFNQTYKKAK